MEKKYSKEKIREINGDEDIERKLGSWLVTKIHQICYLSGSASVNFFPTSMAIIGESKYTGTIFYHYPCGIFFKHVFNTNVYLCQMAN